MYNILKIKTLVLLMVILSGILVMLSMVSCGSSRGVTDVDVLEYTEAQYLSVKDTADYYKSSYYSLMKSIDRRDSVNEMFRDSVYVYQNGDTVRVTTVKYRYKYVYQAEINDMEELYADSVRVMRGMLQSSQTRVDSLLSRIHVEQNRNTTVSSGVRWYEWLFIGIFLGLIFVVVFMRMLNK